MADDDNAAARIIAQLSAEAELVDHGAFTLDPAAARQKLREHQLASEGAWALLLVEAGELAGLDRIEVSEGLTSVQVRLLGQGVARLAPFEQLDMLFAWAFAPRDAASSSEMDADIVEARRLLALAVNDALGRSVELTVMTAERGIRLQFDAATSHRTEVRGGRPALIVKIAVPIRRTLSRPAEALLEVARRAGYGRAQVFVARRRIIGEVPQADGCFASRPLTLDGREIGLVGLRAQDHGPPRIVAAPNGVRYEAMDLGAQPSAFFAVVTRGLDRDLSFTRVVENEAYSRVRTAVRAAQREFAAMEATMPLVNETVALSSWSPDLGATLLQITSVALIVLAVIALNLTLSGSGLLTAGTIFVVVIAVVLSAVSWLAGVRVRWLHGFSPGKPKLTAEQERLFFGDPNQR